MLFKILTAFLISSSNDNDIRFHTWCDKVGIETPLAQLRTTPESVAGRGVFAYTDNREDDNNMMIREGDVVIRIPESVVLHEYNGQKYLPHVGQRLQSCKDIILSSPSSISSSSSSSSSTQTKKKKWWNRFSFLSKKRKTLDGDTEEEEEEQQDATTTTVAAEAVTDAAIEGRLEFTTPADFWMAELTCYSVAACAMNSSKELNDGQQLWKSWIEQWQRDDPMYRLLKSGTTLSDRDAIKACVRELQQLLPDVKETTISAAVDIRLGRLDELRQIFNLSNEEVVMYGTLISRAVTLGEGLVGVIPCYDMINHSTDPNLSMSFDGTHFELWANRDIKNGEELFLCYNADDELEMWDEYNAVWTLVQWGIPQRRVNVEPALSTV